MLKFLKKQRGDISPHIALIISITVLMLAVVFGVELIIVPKAQNTLQTAAGMLAKSESINGCITNNTQTAVKNYLSQNQIDPQKVFFKASPNAAQTYGTSVGTAAQPNIILGYDLDLFDLSSIHIWHQYIEGKVPVNMSAYVPNITSDTSGCVNSPIFGGTQITPGQIGTGSSSSGPSSSVTPGQLASSVSAVIPNPVSQGVLTSITGTTDLPLSQVSIFGAGYSATTTADASGNFSFPAIFTVAGTNQPITVASGTASQVYNVTVIPDAIHSVIFTGPSPASVKIGQPFTILGVAYDSNGVVLPDGTTLNITSSDTTDIPNQTVLIAHGQFSISVPNGITQNISSLTVTDKDTSPSTNFSIAVTPSDPQKITLTANNMTPMAGNSVSFSGSVYGYSNTPVQDNTAVQIADNGNMLGTVYTTGGNYTLTVPLTTAGNNTIVAQVSGYTSVQTTINITINPSVPYSIVGLVASPSPVNVGSNTGISGLLKDQYGNLISGQSYTLQTNLSTPNPTSISTTGTFGFNASFNSPGYQTISLSYGGRQIGSLSVDVVSNVASNGFTLRSSQSTYTITAGQSVSVTFALTDSNGNPVPGQTITFSGVSGSPTSATTDSNGHVTFISSAITAAKTYTLSATGSSVPNLTSMVGIAVNPGPSNKVVVTVSPSTTEVWTTGNQVSLPTVFGSVTDVYGNIIPTANVTISGGYGVSASGVVGANGYFSISLTPTNVGGPYPLNFTITSSYGNCSTTQGTLTVTAIPTIPVQDVLQGVVIDGQTGTMPNRSGSFNYTTWTNGNADSGVDYLVPQGYYDGNTQIWSSDGNLVPGNIKSGVSIFGVTGTYAGSSSSSHGTMTWKTPGTYYWTVPDGVTGITAIVCGAGAGGGGADICEYYNGTFEYGGGGGGAGGTYIGMVLVTPGQVVTVVVGAGGQGGKHGSYIYPWSGAYTEIPGTTGGAGGNSYIGSAIGYGGSGGQAASAGYQWGITGGGGTGGSGGGLGQGGSAGITGAYYAPYSAPVTGGAGGSASFPGANNYGGNGTTGGDGSNGGNGEVLIQW